jgi:hypothetical protein
MSRPPLPLHITTITFHVSRQLLLDPCGGDHGCHRWCPHCRNGMCVTHAILWSAALLQCNVTLQPSAEDDADDTGYHHREETIHLCAAVVRQMCWMLILQPFLVASAPGVIQSSDSIGCSCPTPLKNSYGPQSTTAFILAFSEVVP